MNAYHKFLLKHRPYCEKCSVMTLTPATDVIRERGHDIAVCKTHSEGFRPIETGLRERARREAGFFGEE